MVAAHPQKTATSSSIQAIDERADADERAVAERVSKAGKQATPSATKASGRHRSRCVPAALAVASTPAGCMMAIA